MFVQALFEVRMELTLLQFLPLNLQRIKNPNHIDDSTNFLLQGLNIPIQIAKVQAHEFGLQFDHLQTQNMGRRFDIEFLNYLQMFVQVGDHFRNHFRLGVSFVRLIKVRKKSQVLHVVHHAFVLAVPPVQWGRNIRTINWPRLQHLMSEERTMDLTGGKGTK